MRRLSGLAAFTVLATPLAGQSSAEAGKAATTISEADIMHRVGVIADDSMMGRDTPSRGLDLTARYVADQFKKFGLKPGGDDGSWLQQFPFDTGTVPNTVGILEGSDPKLKDEYIVISAHMDHIGIASGQEDSINNGADDNAGGTAGVIELAEAFSQPGARPKRSLIFVTYSGEEKGLLGSDYFAGHPPVPLKQIVANVNFDMIARGPADTVLVIGLEHSDLGTTFERIRSAHPELRLSPVPNPPAMRMRSSDHYSFARRGVPIIKFGGPSHDDYHQVGDSPDKIDAERETRILRFALYFTQDIGNALPRPQWKQESYDELVDQPGE